jgi:hypothetical protein
VELGERILTELGDPRTGDTLTRWLAHHTAGLIDAAEQAAAHHAPDADDRAARVRAAILDLWQHRSAWPSGWPPPRAAALIHLLDDLPDADDPGWGTRNLLGELQLLHYRLLAALTDVAVADGDGVEQGWLRTFAQWLTPDEVAVLTRVVSAPRRLAILLAADRTSFRPRAGQAVDGSGESAITSAAADAAGRNRTAEDHDIADPLSALWELAEAYREAVADLVQRATSGGGQAPSAGAE